MHSVYLKNRLPHHTTKQTPLILYTGQQPSAKRLRIFGCRVIARNPGKRPAKLDNHTSTGIFLGFTATEKNIYYQDVHTKRIKTATHITFDEANYTLPATQLSPAMAALQKLGYTNKCGDQEVFTTAVSGSDQDDHDSLTGDTLQVQLLSVNGTIPKRATVDSVGYDLYSATYMTLQPNQRVKIPTDVSIIPPRGTYGQIMP